MKAMPYANIPTIKNAGTDISQARPASYLTSTFKKLIRCGSQFIEVVRDKLEKGKTVSQKIHLMPDFETFLLWDRTCTLAVLTFPILAYHWRAIWSTNRRWTILQNNLIRGIFRMRCTQFLPDMSKAAVSFLCRKITTRCGLFTSIVPISSLLY